MKEKDEYGKEFYANDSMMKNIRSSINNPNSIRSNSHVIDSIISGHNEEETYTAVSPNIKSKFNKSKPKESHQQNNITYIQQNIYCSPSNDIHNHNGHQGYTNTTNTNPFISNNGHKDNKTITNPFNSDKDEEKPINNQPNPSNQNQLDQDEDKTKILNTYFSELKDMSINPKTNSSMLHIKHFLAYTKKNKITSLTKPIGPLSGFSGFTYTNQKQNNEDKMGIIINSVKDAHKISFYSIFDGHGGTETADYLKDSLHLEIMNHHQLFTNANFAILTAIAKIEEQLTIDFKAKINKNPSNYKSSGACAVVLITIDDMITVLNVGDSRGILSMNNGSRVNALTIDHKPSLENERVRIIQNGGEIKLDPRKQLANTMRVFPGGLAVSRSLGDIEAKLPSAGGKANVIIGVPDIITFKTRKDFDFIVLGCDGIYEKVSNREICLIVYQTVGKCIDKLFSYEQMLQKCTINIMKEAINKGSKDNLSCIFFCFDSLKTVFDTRNKEKIEEATTLLSRNGMYCDDMYTEVESEYFIWKDTKKMISQKTGINFKQKSILNSNNIQLNTSKLSFEDSNQSNRSDNNKDNNDHKKKNKKGFDWTCCGLFT